MMNNGLCSTDFSAHVKRAICFAPPSAVVTVNSFNLAHDDVPLLNSSSRSLRPATPISLATFHVRLTKDVADICQYVSDLGRTTGVMDQERGDYRRLESFAACLQAGCDL